MADYSAIADVGETLVALLEEQMGDLLDRDEIALASPANVGQGNDWRLTLYLYDVSENPHRKNAKREERNATTMAGVPLELELSYLVTAHPSKGGNDGTAKTKEQHSVLGRAMRVLHDNSILEGSELKGTLNGGERLQITLDSESPDQLINLWNTFQEKPFQPSASYLVTPVVIESTREEDVTRIVEQQVEKYSSSGGGNSE